MARRTFKTNLQEISEALKNEASYGLSDIRQTHERLWFGDAKTLNYWQSSLTEQRTPKAQVNKFEEL